jgi:hypothetical protein
MSRTIALVALAIVAVFISSDRAVHAAAPTTQPVPNVDNGKIKKLVQELELQKTILEARLQASAQAHQGAGNLPYRSGPLTHASPYLPDPDAALGHFQYNGKTVYLVGPLIAKPITVPAKHQDRPDVGTVILAAPVSTTPVWP